jgi:hypothetical protein
MSETPEGLFIETQQKIQVISDKIYEVILANYRFNSSALQDQHRNYRWDTEEVKAHIDAWIIKALGVAIEPEILINNVMKVLNYFMTSSFFISADFLNLMHEIRKTAYPESEENQVSSDRSLDDEDIDLESRAISILLLDAENLNVTADVEAFLAGVCIYPLQIKIAFANWQVMGKRDREFHSRGYELIHVPAGKDSADVKMATVGSSIFVHYPSAKEVFVCSSDEVLTHLCNTLRTHGLNVYLVRKEAENIVVINSRTGQSQTYLPTLIQEVAISKISLPQFISQLKKMIQLEQARTKQSWIKVSTIPNNYTKQYQRTVSEVMDLVLPGKKFKDVFVENSNDFAVHQMAEDGQIYVTLFSNNDLPVAPERSQENPILDADLQQQGLDSPEKLQKVLVKIIQNLTNNNPSKYIRVAEVGQNFYQQYGQPLTKVMKRLKVGSKLPKVLESYPNLIIKPVGNEYEVAIAKRE